MANNEVPVGNRIWNEWKKKVKEMIHKELVKNDLQLKYTSMGNY